MSSTLILNRWSFSLMRTELVRMPARVSLFACLFYESFYDFFFIWSLIYFPLEYMKTTRSWFCVFSRGKTSKFKSRKNRLKSTFSHFFSTGPIILAKGMIWYNVQLSKIIFWKTPAIWDTLMPIQLEIYSSGTNYC